MQMKEDKNRRTRNVNYLIVEEVKNIKKLDLGLKHIVFELDGKRYLMSFRDTFLKGVHDVEIWTSADGKGYRKTEAIIEDTYPDLRKRIKEIWVWYSVVLFKRYRR